MSTSGDGFMANPLPILMCVLARGQERDSGTMNWLIAGQRPSRKLRVYSLLDDLDAAVADATALQRWCRMRGTT